MTRKVLKVLGAIAIAAIGAYAVTRIPDATAAQWAAKCLTSVVIISTATVAMLRWSRF